MRYFIAMQTEVGYVSSKGDCWGITRRDKVRKEDTRKKTGSRKLEDIIKERRLRWLGYALRIDNSEQLVRQHTGN